MLQYQLLVLDFLPVVTTCKQERGHDKVVQKICYFTALSSLSSDRFLSGQQLMIMLSDQRNSREPDFS